MSQTLFERMGGENAVTHMTHFLYVNMLHDDRLKPYFVNINAPRQMLKMQIFLTKVLCGDTSYGAASLQEVQKYLIDQGLNDQCIDVVIECVCMTLQEMQLNNNIIGEVTEKIYQCRDEIINT